MEEALPHPARLLWVRDVPNIETTVTVDGTQVVLAHRQGDDIRVPGYIRVIGYIRVTGFCLFFWSITVRDIVWSKNICFYYSVRV